MWLRLCDPEMKKKNKQTTKQTHSPNPSSWFQRCVFERIIKARHFYIIITYQMFTLFKKLMLHKNDT